MKAPIPGLVWRLTLGATIVLLTSQPALAQLATNNVLDTVINTYRTTVGGWTATLISYATRLFWLLAAIELAWSGAKLALEGADLQQLVSELVRRILYIGIFFWFLANGATFSTNVIDSFRQAAGDASGFATANPSDVIDIGIDIAIQIMDSMSVWGPADALLLLINAIIILGCITWIGAVLLVTLIEMYIMTAAGVFMLGFGGSQWTNDLAKRFMVYVVSIGMKLFILQLLIGLGLTLLTGFVTAYQVDQEQNIVMVAISLTLLALCLKLPEIVQSFVNGAAIGATSGLGQMARMAASAATGGATAVAGGATATVAAAQLAQAQGRGGFFGTMSNLSSALSSTATDRAAGVPSGLAGSLAGNATQRMRNQTAAVSAASGGQQASYITPLDAGSAKRGPVGEPAAPAGKQES